MCYYNFTGMNDIIDMLGSAGLKVEMPKVRNTLFQNQMMPETKTAAQAKVPVKKAMPPSTVQGGIMEQNRMFFGGAVKNNGTLNEYRITRDYLNVTDK